MSDRSDIASRSSFILAAETPGNNPDGDPTAAEHGYHDDGNDPRPDPHSSLVKAGGKILAQFLEILTIIILLLAPVQLGSILLTILPQNVCLGLCQCSEERQRDEQQGCLT